MFLRDALVAACGRPFETGHLRTLQPAQRQGIVCVCVRVCAHVCALAQIVLEVCVSSLQPDVNLWGRMCAGMRMDEGRIPCLGYPVIGQAPR